MTQSEVSALIWSVADLLRGDYRQSEYGKVVLPFTVLRRLECVLEPTKESVLERAKQLRGRVDNPDQVLEMVAGGLGFYNTSPLDLKRVLGDQEHLAGNLRAYLAGFSVGARDILEKFDFDTQIERLDKAGLLYLVVSKFANLDLHPDKVSNMAMGYLYEELIRRFSELSNETAGEHFTPREVIRMMVDLLFSEDDEVLTRPGVVKTLFDPACGTGGMLSVADDHLRSLNPEAHLEVFGQELNDETYAICRSDMMIKGKVSSRIVCGNSFTEDGHKGMRFDYMLANPPFGVEWKKIESEIRSEYASLGFSGRFGAGLPRISDGSFLFLQHMISKMKPVEEGGSRLAIVFNGSPLFTGGAGSGESEIRRWIIENDWLECIVALPTDMFYNTGISTYVWILTNHKSPERRGKIQLINAVDFYQKMRKSLGSKRKEIGPDDLAKIVRLYGAFEENEFSKIFDNEAFGYHTITVERPLQLNFMVSSERLARLDGVKALAKLDGDLETLRSALAGMGQDRTWLNRDAFQADLKKALRSAGLTLTGPQLKAVLQALSEHDDNADVCRDAKGNPEPDPDLRDTEDVPLSEDIHDYFEREVLPHVPDAWIDEDKTKIGYEIPFTRHFYKFVPLRPLEQIDADLKAVTADIMAMLGEMGA